MLELPEILSALTHELVQIRDGGHSDIVFGDRRLEQTEDADFIYVEADLACESETEIDISIHDTRAFIRIERSLPGLDSADEFDADPNSIFGWVEFSAHGVTVRAILSADGLWSCAVAPEVADLLNGEYSPAGDLSDHDSVCDVLIKAADRLQGLAWLDPDGLLDS